MAEQSKENKLMNKQKRKIFLLAGETLYSEDEKKDKSSKKE